MSRHHRIDYVEFPTLDLSTTKNFYAEAFGWEFNDYGDVYAGIRGADPGSEAGGLNATGQAATEGPLVILFSEDLDATLASVRAAGGQIIREPYDFPGGRRFEFTDPNGNQLAVWAESG